MHQNDRVPPSATDTASESISIIGRIVPFIRERGFEPGERIPSERELAERFGVSRGVVREALATLEAMRVVERRPQSGNYLREVSREGSLDTLVLEASLGLPMTEIDVRSLNEFRNLLEAQAVALACERRTEDDLAKLDLVLAQSARDITDGDAMAAHDSAFHLAIFAATQNQYLVRAAYSFYLASQTRRERYFTDSRNRKRSLAQHRVLRDAIAESDVQGAYQALGEHLGGVERFWLATLRNSKHTGRKL